jgi:hypothetical protein
LVKVGIPWAPKDFIERAELAAHPFDQLHCEDIILASAFCVATCGPQALATLRAEALAKWTARARELQAAADELHAAAHPDVRVSLGSKRLFLFREMLEQVHFPNARELVDNIVTGFVIAGRLPSTGVFPTRQKPATGSLEDLVADARTAQATLLASVGPSPDSEMDNAVYDKTREEVERGWLAAG